MPDAMLIAAARTPIGKYLGGLAELSAPELGAIALGGALSRARLTADRVNEVIMGNVIQAGLGQNPARQAALRAGMPDTVGALTINKVCGSGLKAVGLAAQAIQVGDIEIAVAGGMESMSNAPYLIPKFREGLRLGNGHLIDAVISDGLWDAYENCHMGCTGEVVAEKYGISREQQDQYALNSHRKAVAAMESCRFA